MMNIDRLAESYYASSDPQNVDWESLNRADEIKEIQNDINLFEPEEDMEDTIVSARTLIERALDAEVIDEVDWDCMEEKLGSVWFEIMRW